MANERLTQEHNHYKRAVGVFKRREDTEAVLRTLRDAGYDMNSVSLIARHVEDIKGADEVTDRHGNEAGEGAGIGATTGTVLGGIGGFLVGAGVLAIPGVGPILAAGVGISELAATLAGAGIGAATGGIVGALVGAGIPEERSKVYNERVKAGDHLLMVNGTDDELGQVEEIMRDHNVEEFGIFAAPDLSPQSTRVDAEPARLEQPVATRKVHTDTRDMVTRETHTNTRDIDSDGEPEVIIVDRRSETTKRNEIR